MNNTTKICIWPDGTWCYYEEVESYETWMSDDYNVEKVPDTMEHEEICNFVDDFLKNQGKNQNE